ncbi:formylmethanofuran dehydrogenase subunit C, partial [Candidatus Hakubella thermalkaliphila]
ELWDSTTFTCGTSWEALLDKVILRLKERSNIPVEAEAICPDLFLTKSQQEIEELALYYGNKGRRLGDFFQVQGERSDNIVIEGEIPNFKNFPGQ